MNYPLPITAYRAATLGKRVRTAYDYAKPYLNQHNFNQAKKIATWASKRYRSRKTYKKKAPYNMRKSARVRTKRQGRLVRHRGIRETKTEVQEIHRFLRAEDGVWDSHRTHANGETAIAQLITNKPNTADAHHIKFDVTQHLFANTTNIMNNQDCSIDVSGIKFTIDIENPSTNDEIYVRTLLLMNKNAAGGANDTAAVALAAMDLQDELFQDPHDKCKRLDFNDILPTHGDNSYPENAKMKMPINKVRRSVYHDRVVKVGHDMRRLNGDGTINFNVTARKSWQTSNQRRIVIKWFPRGGFRFKVAMDGENRKTHMEQILQFMMFTEKKAFMSETKPYTPTELNFKIRAQLWYKRVY